ncbi:MAG TPA: EscU/YscU/HrcU family type III secretion system export apparatus switch protein [Terriglobales bacterium]|nr:EscU/YscU/HrcU family type III secretion system export apparatus switch protein [Terriglobales bacterium]
MADASKTEKPTPQKRKKAREQGQVARSRELSSALAWGGAMAVIAWQTQDIPQQWRGLLQRLLEMSLADSLTTTSPVLLWTGVAVLRWIVPVMLASWAIALSAGVAQGGLVFAPEALAFKPEKLSPANKLKQMFSLTGLSGILKSLIPFAVIAWIGVSTIQKSWHSVVEASDIPVRPYAGFLASTMWGLCWKAGLVLVCWSAVDYLLVWRKLEGDLKMSRQDLREELKQTDGNPATKGRIRRIQRQMRRRKMLQDTKQASVVITNPTHFAVALKYEMSMEAPIVVAKGQNLLAQEIKEIARWHGITVLENPPLAQTLYRTVEVGQAIPAELYAVVAEILAFVFRTQAQAQVRKPAPIQ